MTTPQPIHPPLAPVPAMPIVVVSMAEGACIVRAAGAVASGVTLRRAVEAAITLHAQKDQP